MIQRRKPRKLWALYQGEEMIDSGTSIEIAGRRGVTVNSLLHLKRPSRIKRVAHYSDALVLVDITNDDDERVG